MEEAEIVTALAALAQSARLRVFRALVVAGPQGMTPGGLADALAVPASTLSFHLKELMHAGLISQQRDGRSLIYRAAFDRMNALMGYQPKVKLAEGLRRFAEWRQAYANGDYSNA